jgi:hypothetical protein
MLQHLSGFKKYDQSDHSKGTNVLSPSFLVILLQLVQHFLCSGDFKPDAECHLCPDGESNPGG